MADALFEVAEVMIGGIKGMLRVSRFVIPSLDITRFLAVQETDNVLVHCCVPVCISPSSFIAQVGIGRLFPHGPEGPVDHFGKLIVSSLLLWSISVPCGLVVTEDW